MLEYSINKSVSLEYHLISPENLILALLVWSYHYIAFNVNLFENMIYQNPDIGF